MRRGTPGAIELGKWLKEIREKKGLTMAEVVEVTGGYPGSISQIEKGQRALKEKKIEVWAQALGIATATLQRKWRECNRMEAPPITRTRKRVTSFDVQNRFDELTAVERCRVLGYIDCLIDQRSK